jgi:hypothetical protein
MYLNGYNPNADLIAMFVCVHKCISFDVYMRPNTNSTLRSVLVAQAALTNRSRAILSALYIQESLLHANRKDLDNLMSLARRKDIKIIPAEKSRLYTLIGANRPHQGVVLECHQIELYRAQAREIDSGELVVLPEESEEGADEGMTCIYVSMYL